MARGGAAFGETEIIGLPRGDRGSSDLRAVVPCYARARQSVVVQVCATRRCHGSPIVSASTTRRGLARTRVPAVRCRSSRRGESRQRSMNRGEALPPSTRYPSTPRCPPRLRRGRNSCGGLLPLPFLSTPWFRSDLDRFRFHRAVSLFQSRASGLFVLDDVRHGRRVATFGYDRAICDFERLLADSKRFRGLIDRRNRPTKWRWAHGWFGGWRCRCLWRTRG